MSCVRAERFFLLLCCDLTPTQELLQRKQLPLCGFAGREECEDRGKKTKTERTGNLVSSWYSSSHSLLWGGVNQGWNVTAFCCSWWCCWDLTAPACAFHGDKHQYLWPSSASTDFRSYLGFLLPLSPSGTNLTRDFLETFSICRKFMSHVSGKSGWHLC